MNIFSNTLPYSLIPISIPCCPFPLLLAGSMLMMIMKMVSVAFDLDAATSSTKSSAYDGKWSSIKKDKSSTNKEKAADEKVKEMDKSDKHLANSGKLRKRNTRSSGGVTDNERSTKALRKSVSKSIVRGDDLEMERSGKATDNTLPLLDFACYTMSPLTGTFGPFLTLEEHQQLLVPAPLVSMYYLQYVIKLFACQLQ